MQRDRAVGCRRDLVDGRSQRRATAGVEAVEPAGSFGSQTMAKRSPPRPQAVGSIRPRQALVAMAASTALPPALSMSMPAPAASGCEQQTMPLAAHDGERVAAPRPVPMRFMGADATGVRQKLERTRQAGRSC